MSIAAEHPISPVAAECIAIIADAERLRRCMEIADYAGWQDDDNGGGFELWCLRVSLPRHPVNSTVSRATLERYFSEVRT